MIAGSRAPTRPTSTPPGTPSATPRGRASTRSSRPPTSTSSTSCRRTREDVKGQARAAVAHAKQYLEDVEFSPMDATRADVEFTAEVLPDRDRRGRDDDQHPRHGRLHDAARVRRVPDAPLRAACPALRDVVISVHCHDDLGLAVANSFAGLARRRAPGRVRDQRDRRARRQRLARGDRDAARTRARPTSACTPASTRARSRAPAGWSRA